MKKYSVILIFLCIVCHSLQAQSLDAPIYTKDKKIPSFINVPEGIIKRDRKSNGKEATICRLLNLNKETSLTLRDTLTDIARGYHETYKQLYKGIVVEGAKCVVHYNSTGIAKMISGNLKTIENLDVTPIITAWQSKSIAIEITKRNENLTACRIQSANYKYNDSLINCSDGELVVFMANDIPYLAYKHQIRSVIPSLNKRIYIDALTGDYLGGYSTIFNISTNASTVYSGIRPIETQYISNSYVLRDNTRGYGIMTYRQNESDYISSDNSWSNLSDYDRAAIDAHWGVEKTCDFYYNRFGRNSYDNNCSSITSYVNCQVYNYNLGWIDYDNAAWDEEYHCIYYGRENNNPIVSLDVTAHELTHGFTQYTSNLNYEKESGAINEGMSDVFGVCVENEYKTNSEIWKIGEDFSPNDCRDLSNPTCKYYQGNGWVNTNQTPTENNDYCGVHSNSGVFGYWFYLLAHGGSGTNEAGVNYTVYPIGLAYAIQICYQANAVFLCSDSDYFNARLCTLFAAQSLGYNSNIMKQINNAWEAVGVCCLSGPTMPGSSSIYEVHGLPAGCNVTWTYTPKSGTSLSSGTLVPNSPTTYQCTINNSSKQYINGTLTATITLNGTTTAFIEKEIRSGDGFSASCSQPLGYIIPVHGDIANTSSTSGEFSDDAAFAVKKSSLYSYPVTITSPYFTNATITHTSISGLSWQHSGNTITLSYPANNNIDPVLVVTGKKSTDYRVYRFSIYSQLDILLQLTATVSGRDLLLNLSASEESIKNASTEALQSLAEELAEKEWTVTVVSATTGKKVFSQEAKGSSFTIDTTGWESGIYVIKANVGDRELIQKVLVK